MELMLIRSATDRLKGRWTTGAWFNTSSIVQSHEPRVSRPKSGKVFPTAQSTKGMTSGTKINSLSDETEDRTEAEERHYDISTATVRPKSLSVRSTSTAAHSAHGLSPRWSVAHSWSANPPGA
ncbi:hypothetical protein PGTUg99_036039 [Puccinia graminis f. sp. tritici]|uniref:Uncharacterized protein n=1 Tax=Puccinia graminis f. sp. tritici TaxID=56615 RepID=A0A5B0QVC4_PUCGR|nr:hypothetical protein PGTUg99_036039 [Puccinia graminis f. sp. tritici]